MWRNITAAWAAVINFTPCVVGESASVAQAGSYFFLTIQIYIGKLYKYNIKSFCDKRVLYL